MQPPKPSGALAFVSAAAACALIVLAGCHTQRALTPEQAEGKRLYDVGCAHCHEQNDLRLKTVPPDLHDLFSRKSMPDGAPATDAEVGRVILHGKGLMPSFAYQMTQPQLDALLAYLHTGLKDENNP